MDGDDMFLFAFRKITIMLEDDYSIVCEGTAAIGAGGTIYLGVNDDSQELSVTVYGNYFPNVKAVDGCKVSCSKIDNGGGKHTFMFMVSKN